MDEKTNDIINKLKSIVFKYDNNAEIILFGSRARGDWHEQSDWDFLILSDLEENAPEKEMIRKDISNEIELVSFDIINFLFHNKEVWYNEYAVTNIFDSIKEDGVAV